MARRARSYRRDSQGARTTAAPRTRRGEPTQVQASTWQPSRSEDTKRYPSVDLGRTGKHIPAYGEPQGATQRPISVLRYSRTWAWLALQSRHTAAAHSWIARSRAGPTAAP